MKRIISILLVCGVLLSLLTGCVEENDPNNSTGENVVKLDTPTAMVSFGDSAVAGVELEEPVNLKTVGTSETKKVQVLVGDNDGSYSVRTLKGFESEMTFTITGVMPDQPAMLDIEEIHLRTDKAVCYSVFVNDAEVFGRSYEPIADGPNHAFFDIPASVVGSSGSLTVRIVNKTEGEIRFRRVWAISDPETKAAEQGISKKMDVVLMLNEQPNNLNMEYLKSLVESYKCAGMYNIGLCWEIQYLQWGKKNTEAWLNNVLMASAQTGAVLYLGINSWWGGSPSGPDGLGGAWQDPTYHQITYDHKNTDGRGQWQLSSPNEWSNTPWLSMNNDYYNSVRLQRIRETVEFIQLRTAEMALAGQDLPAVHLYTENEPYYWPINWKKYDFNNYPTGVGDFSAYVVEDAAKDGITLDPTDGLSKEEAFWLYRNLHTYISEVGSAMAEGLGYNYITVKDGEIHYPTEQIVSDSYSHTPIHYIYPNWDENQRAWENHVLDSIHFGGEWSVYQDQDNVRALDYLIAYGSFSNINAERAGFPGGFGSKDFRVLSQCYAYGLEGVIIYNVLKDSDQDNVIGESTVENTLMEVRQYAADSIFESDFSQRTAFALNKTLKEISGLRWDGLAVIPTGEGGGALTYRLANAGDYDKGLQVDVTGNFAVDGGKLEILAGGSAEDLRSVGVFDSATQVVRIDPSFYAGSDEVYIRVRIFGDGLTNAQLASLGISRVAICRPSIKSGCTDGSVYTYAQNRVRCQIIAARADVERLLNSYMEKAGGTLTTESQKANFTRAYNLYAKGNYGEAFTAISQAVSQLLPATFTVSGYGRLGEYPVEIAVDGTAKVTVTLKEVSDSQVRFSMSASSDADVTVSLLTASGKWGMTQTENGDWLIAAGDTAPVDGKAGFRVSLEERVAKVYPKEFEARIYHASPSGVHLLSQNPEVTDYCHSTEFLLAMNAVIRRGADGTAVEDLQECDVSHLQSGDYVQIKLNDQGRIAEINAWYGQITGKVIKVEQIDLQKMTNAAVTIQAADGTTKRLEIGYDTLLNFAGATGEMGKLALVDSLGLWEGQTITATYCPYTVNGRTRAMELRD